MKISLPLEVNQIIQTLNEHGYEAYAVGGCIRDSVLFRIPKDWDITTSATPEMVKQLFPRTIDTGIAHGTVTVMINHQGFEVTTYRIDGEYEDARHPKQVSFTSSLSEDLKRRDFTMNALAYHETEGLVDLFGGLADMEQGIIRCVGDPMERFREDALRMMRAVRFSAQLGFSIEAHTKEGIQVLAPNIAKVSAERIQAELVKLLVSPHPEALLEAYQTGLTAVFFPEFDQMMITEQNSPHHCYTVGEHTIKALQQIEPDKVKRLTMLLHDIAKPICKTTDENGVDHFREHPVVGAKMAKDVLQRLKFDNETIERVYQLVYYHDDKPAATEKSVRRAMNRVGILQYPALFSVKRSDIQAQSMYLREEKLAYVDEYETLYHKILEQNQCFSLKQLAVNGKDLMALGMKPGKELGEMLQQLLEEVLEQPEKNTKEALFLEAGRLISHKE